MRLLIFCLLMVNAPLMASELKSLKAQKLAEQLVRSINQKLTEIAELEMAAGVEPEDIVITLSQTERFDSGRFGAILDNNNTGKIVSVTPKSPASILGVQSGDVLVAVNDHKISASETSWRTELQFAKDKTPINLTVRRDGKEQELSGLFSAKYTPQWQLNSSKKLLIAGGVAANYIPIWQLEGSAPLAPKSPTGNDSELPSNIDLSKSCGRAIVGKTLTKSVQERFFGLTSVAVITEIDGQPIVKGKTRHRLSAGSHTLKVGTFHNNKATAKKFSLTVQPNTNYYIAYVTKAKWQDKQGNLVDKKPYTGPVIYKTREADCEL